MRAFGALTLLLIPALAGCLGGGGFSWPEPQPHDCRGSDEARLRCVTVWDGFDTPVWATHAGDGSGALYVVDQVGLIWKMEDDSIGDTPWLDLRAKVTDCHPEQGLLGLAFPDDFASSQQFFVTYTEKKKCPGAININEPLYNKGDLLLMRITVGDDDGTEMLRVPEPYRNHNGGHILFGPDGFLYMGVGDGGDHGDPLQTGQDRTDLLGSILRLDVSGDAAAPAAGNPWEDEGGDAAMVWAYGLRNPWRFHIETEGSIQLLRVADVGQDCFEELNEELNVGGINFGWSEFEGDAQFQPGQKCAEAERMEGGPAVVYGRDQGCSITGGLPAPDSWGNGESGHGFLFSDFCTGTLWSTGGDAGYYPIMQTGLQVTSFAEDEAGNVYLLHWGGSIHRIEPTA